MAASGRSLALAGLALATLLAAGEQRPCSIQRTRRTNTTPCQPGMTQRGGRGTSLAGISTLLRALCSPAPWLLLPPRPCAIAALHVHAVQSRPISSRRTPTSATRVCAVLTLG